MTGAALWSRRNWPWLIIGAYTAIHTYLVRDEARSVVPFRGNDYAIHISMVRWATERFEAGRLPFDGWFPDLALGSPQFHQYQSLPHVVAGFFGQVFDPAAIVHGTGFLMLAAWPLLMFVGIRMLTGDDLIALFAGVFAPLLSSADTFGYEYSAYVFRGHGLWANLISMSLVPFAVALSWRVVMRGRRYALAALVLGITIACHFITGWLLLLWLGIAALVGPGPWRSRLFRAAVLAVGSLLVASVALIPLVSDSEWIGKSELLPSWLYDSYGARQVLSWLSTGRLFDAEHQWFPIVTLLVVTGAVVCVTRWKRDALARAVLVFFLASLVLFFGRPTLGPVLDVLPFTSDMVLHRLIAGVHLGGLLLAAMGAATLVRLALGAYRRFEGRVSRTVFVAGVSVVALAAVAPAWTERYDYLAGNRILLERQIRANDAEQADLRAVIDFARARGGGRIYAGSPRNYGAVFQIGYSTVYEQLLWHDALGLGFIGRSASLSVDPEIAFDPENPAHFPLYGVRYLILPDVEPAVPAILVYQRGRFRLFEVPPQRTFLDVYDSVPPVIRTDRASLGSALEPYLRSHRPERGIVQPIDLDGRTHARPTTRDRTPEGSAGEVVRERARPEDGVFIGTVDTTRRAVVVLKESFHGRWRATVDGRSRPIQMVTPSFVGVTVGPGRHHVEFRYEPYPTSSYVLLLVLALATLVMLVIVPRRINRA